MPDTVEMKRLEVDATMREIYDLRVFVIGGGFQYLKMFFDAGMKGARSVEDADIVCFTGGEDVDPAFYGEEPIEGTYYNTKRDKFEAELFSEAVKAGKPMIGICRGGQFLNVMNKGTLWQDVNNHAIRGGHHIVNLKTGEDIPNMTSTHHQQMVPGEGGEVLAMACESTKKMSQSALIDRKNPDLDDVEVVWYPGTLSLCFQPHPEFAHGDCRNYFLDLVDEYILPAC